MPGLRSGVPELLVHPLPRWVLHRRGRPAVPGVSPRHLPVGSAHLRPGRVRRLRARKRRQQGAETDDQQSAAEAVSNCALSFQEHSFCYSDCSFTYTGNNRTMTFDLRAMSNASSLTVGPSFTSKGTKYLHVFNISLCGDKVTSAPVGGGNSRDAWLGLLCSGSPQGRRGAVCSDNVTGVSSKEEQSAAAPSGNLVESFICQSTIVPADGRTFRASVASQSVSLADTFIGQAPAPDHPKAASFPRSLTLRLFPGATVDAALDGIDARPDLFPDSPRAVPDIHFYYR